MPEDMTNNTITFSLEEVREADMKRILLTVYDALKEKGLQPHQPDRGIPAQRGPYLYHHPTTTPAAWCAASTGMSS